MGKYKDQGGEKFIIKYNNNDTGMSKNKNP